MKKKVTLPKRLTNKTICRAEQPIFYLLTQNLNVARTNVMLNHSLPCWRMCKPTGLNQGVMHTFVHTLLNKG